MGKSLEITVKLDKLRVSSHYIGEDPMVACPVIG